MRNWKKLCNELYIVYILILFKLLNQEGEDSVTYDGMHGETRSKTSKKETTWNMGR
jgi:hypothetical protein